MLPSHTYLLQEIEIAIWSSEILQDADAMKQTH